MSMTVDEAAGQAISLYRSTRGWTQNELAGMVKARGLSLAQQTIAKIEAGTRPLKLSEAVVFSDVLGVKVDDLLDYSTDGVSRLLIEYWAEELDNARAALGESVQRYEKAKVTSAVIVARAELTQFRYEVGELRAKVEDWFDYQELSEMAEHRELTAIEDRYERITANEMLGFDGDPAS